MLEKLNSGLNLENEMSRGGRHDDEMGRRPNVLKVFAEPAHLQ
jgi:hypothetical protein